MQCIVPPRIKRPWVAMYTLIMIAALAVISVQMYARPGTLIWRWAS